MSADPLQTLAAAKTAAAPSLAAFGAALIYDLHADEEAHKTAIAARIASAGVCIEIGSVTAPTSAETIGGALTPLVGSFEVFAAEKIGGTHTPAGPALWRAIVAALCADRLPGEDNGFSCTGYDALVTERGYVLHVLSFTHPIFVT